MNSVDPTRPPDDRKGVWLCFLARIGGKVVHGLWIDVTVDKAEGVDHLADDAIPAVMAAAHNGVPWSLETWDPDISVDQPIHSMSDQTTVENLHRRIRAQTRRSHRGQWVTRINYR